MDVYVLSDGDCVLGVYESLSTIEENWDIEFEEVAFGVYEATSENGTTFEAEQFELVEG